MAKTRQYDMHTHSHYSDGTNSPFEIAEMVYHAGLAGFSLTDHDTVQGWGEAQAAAEFYSLEFIPGIELSTGENGVSSHILGYGFDPLCPELQQVLADISAAREQRMRKIVVNLSRDFKISWERVQAVSLKTRTIGRPHLADALIAAGYMTDRREAFSTVLSPKSAYYEPLPELQTLTAVQLLRKAGAAVVLAHPAADRNRTLIKRTDLLRLISAGLCGIELKHPENDELKLAKIKSEVRGIELIETGSSDFHGAGKPNKIGDATTSAAAVKLLRAEMSRPTLTV